jgi:hypothetical protein
MRNLRFLAVILLASPLLAGCIFFEGSISRQMERSPSFKSGYSDGCSTVSSSSANYREEQKVYKDESAYKTDKAYRAGWSAGYVGCRPDLGQTEQPRSGPIADPYPRQ